MFFFVTEFTKLFILFCKKFQYCRLRTGRYQETRRYTSSWNFQSKIGHHFGQKKNSTVSRRLTIMACTLGTVLPVVLYCEVQGCSCTIGFFIAVCTVRYPSKNAVGGRHHTYLSAVRDNSWLKLQMSVSTGLFVGPLSSPLLFELHNRTIQLRNRKRQLIAQHDNSTASTTRCGNARYCSLLGG